MDSLINGLNTLAPGNHLRVLNLNLNAAEGDVTVDDIRNRFTWKGLATRDICDLFRRSSSDFLEAISGLRGLQEFRCDKMDLVRETDPDVWKAFRAFKAMMESQSLSVVEVEDAEKEKEKVVVEVKEA